MVAATSLGALQRILFLYVPAGGDDLLLPALRAQGLAVTPALLAVDAVLPNTDADVVLIRSSELGPSARSAAQRLRRLRPHLPLILWARLTPDRLEDALNAGFDLWLPAETPVTGVTTQVQAICRLLGTRQRHDSELVTVKGVTIDFRRREATVAGQAVSLTPTEFRILGHLARQPGRATSHGELFRAVHGWDTAEREAKDVVKVHISRLRTKIEAAGGPHDFVGTVRGHGYLLERRTLGARVEAVPDA